MTTQRRHASPSRRYRKSFGKPGGSTVALCEFAETMIRIEHGVTAQQLADAAALLRSMPNARQQALPFGGKS